MGEDSVLPTLNSCHQKMCLEIPHGISPSLSGGGLKRFVKISKEGPVKIEKSGGTTFLVRAERF